MSSIISPDTKKLTALKLNLIEKVVLPQIIDKITELEDRLWKLENPTAEQRINALQETDRLRVLEESQTTHNTVESGCTIVK